MTLSPAGTDAVPADSPATALPSPDVASLIGDPNDLTELQSLAGDPDALFTRFAQSAEDGGTTTRHRAGTHDVPAA